eukprot:TRINITY_DN3786_c0_g1_i1.p1 TRINITY_DN3786_c0_g1~~TRINITY_DN3786_c0_g1_i1.p1  ORF type:complete len:456 (-),score=100.76 TRINITY_DN3786_c0_g1_i1:107-1474(-)
MAHDDSYLNELGELIPYDAKSDLAIVCAGVQNKPVEELDPENFDTFCSFGSLKAAYHAAGAVCDAVDAVSKGHYRNAFCAIRPPGHHAGRTGQTADAPSQGFCLINNVAIGAFFAHAAAGFDKVAVFDFDVHHGNGTQDILASNEHFLFISIHVFDEKKYFFPGTGTVADNQDNVLNVPLKRHSGSNTYQQAFNEKVIPKLEQFRPQLIMLSAGFDGHKDDPTKGLRLSAKDFFYITTKIMEVADRCCDGRIVSVLEGGYDVCARTNALQDSVRAHLAALIGRAAATSAMRSSPSSSPTPAAPTATAVPGPVVTARPHSPRPHSPRPPTESPASPRARSPPALLEPLYLSSEKLSLADPAPSSPVHDAPPLEAYEDGSADEDGAGSGEFDDDTADDEAAASNGASGSAGTSASTGPMEITEPDVEPGIIYAGCPPAEDEPPPLSPAPPVADAAYT